MRKPTLRRKAEPPALKAEDANQAVIEARDAAERIIAAKDEQIRALREQAAEDKEQILALQRALTENEARAVEEHARANRTAAENVSLREALASRAAPGDLSLRAERAEVQVRYAAAGLEKLARPSGMTIAARAQLAAQLLTALDVPAGEVTRDPDGM